jgi:hypothetical protein
MTQNLGQPCEFYLPWPGTSADIHGQASTGPAWNGWAGQHETMPIDYVLDRQPSFLSGGGGGGWETADHTELQRLEYNTEDRPPNDEHVASVLGLRLIYCTPPEAAGEQGTAKVKLAGWTQNSQVGPAV